MHAEPIARLLHLQQALEQAVEAAGSEALRVVLSTDGAEMEIYDLRPSIAMGCLCWIGIYLSVARKGQPYDAGEPWIDAPLESATALLKHVRSIQDEASCNGVDWVASHKFPSRISVNLEDGYLEFDFEIVRIEGRPEGVLITLRPEGSDA